MSRVTIQKIKCIRDNPNLSYSKLAEFLGLNYQTVRKIAMSNNAKWLHRGFGLPFISESTSGGGINYKLRFRNLTIASCSTIDSAMLNLDRLIYCLENNNGQLPKTLSEWVLSDLEFKSN